VLRYQVVQEARDRIDLRIVKKSRFTPVTEAEIRRALAEVGEPFETRGRLTRAAGLVMEAVGLKLPVGAQVLVVQGDGLKLDAEVVGFSGERLFLMPTSEPQGLRPGALVRLTV